MSKEPGRPPALDFPGFGPWWWRASHTGPTSLHGPYPNRVAERGKYKTPAFLPLVRSERRRMVLVVDAVVPWPIRPHTGAVRALGVGPWEWGGEVPHTFGCCGVGTSTGRLSGGCSVAGCGGVGVGLGSKVISDDVRARGGGAARSGAGGGNETLFGGGAGCVSGLEKKKKFQGLHEGSFSPRITHRVAEHCCVVRIW